MSAVLLPVPPEKLAAAWDHLSAHIEKLAEITYGRLTTDDIRKHIEAGNFQLWAVVGEDNQLLAVVTTEIIQYPQRRACRVVGCVGENRGKWIHLFDEIQDWARSQGCAAMEIFARKGWAKVLPDFRLTSILLERSL